MQALCHVDAQGGRLDVPLVELAREAEAKSSTLAYARTLCEHYALAADDVDGRLGRHLDDRKLGRVDAVSRNVLRVAVIELLQGKIPPKVALNEAIELAREFADDDTARFVNGVLDPLYRDLKESV